MNKPFAITLDVGSSLANKTGSWRTERPVYVDLLPPCNDACPAGENIQQWLYEAEEGGEGYERAWRKIMEDNPFPAVMGRVCYHPCETACNRAQLDEAVGINSVERFLGDEAIAQGWRSTADAPPSGKRVLVVGAGPSGLSAAYHLARLGHDGHGPRRRERGRRDDALRHPALPAAARDPRRRDRPDRRARRDVRAGDKVTTSSSAMQRGRFDAVFLAVGAHIGKRAYVPAGDGGADPRRGLACCAAWRARSGRCSAAVSRSTAAGTPRWTPRAPRSGSARRRRWSSTGARATGCRRTTSRSRRPRRRACG